MAWGISNSAKVGFTLTCTNGKIYWTNELHRAWQQPVKENPRLQVKNLLSPTYAADDLQYESGYLAVYRQGHLGGGSVAIISRYYAKFIYQDAPCHCFELRAIKEMPGEMPRATGSSLGVCIPSEHRPLDTWSWCV